jgi:hypothetical protein
MVNSLSAEDRKNLRRLLTSRGPSGIIPLIKSLTKEYESLESGYLCGSLSCQGQDLSHALGKAFALKEVINLLNSLTE